jgi:hypothetical protein
MLKTRVVHRSGDWMAITSDHNAIENFAVHSAKESRKGEQPREQTIIITSGHKQLPDLAETNTIDEWRMLTDDREEAA